jgi:hypothetical protein
MITWAEFVTEVEGFLPIEAQRRGIETYRSKLVLAGARDLMRFIPRYRPRYELHFPRGQTEEGEVGVASYGVILNLPPHTFVEARLFDRDDEAEGVATDPVALQKNSRPVDWVDWQNRDKIARGELCDAISINPYSSSFIVSPSLSSEFQLVVWLDHDGETFAPTTQTVFDVHAAEAVAQYVMKFIALKVNNDIAASREWSDEYTRLRRKLLLDRRKFASERAYIMWVLEPAQGVRALFSDGTPILNHLGQPMYFTISNG